MQSVYPPQLTWSQPIPHHHINARAHEESLIDGTLLGRHDAFMDLIQPHLGALTRLARVRLHNQTEAEDVVQQSVLWAFMHLRKFRREASFKTWLSAIAGNETLRTLERRTSLRIQPLQDRTGYADPSSSPHVECEKREEVQRLRRALLRLPEKYRVIIQLRDLSELSVEETARALSLTSAAVRTRHHRARKLLSLYLSPARRRPVASSAPARLALRMHA
jgi:RNA polymerase sigma-70 factor (ECF subfamily)